MATLLIICLLSSQDMGPLTACAPNEELQAYLMEAAENNPTLAARYAEWQAALERIPQAKSLDDPVFTYGQFLQSDVGRVKFMLAQKFPWFGTLRARGDKAAAEADAALHRFYAERNRVLAEVKRAYFEYAFLAENLRITESQVELLGYMEEIVQVKYSVGTASEEDVLRVQIEKVKIEDRRDRLLEYRSALSARLSSALGKDVLEPLPWPQESQAPPPPPDLEQVRARIRELNPELAALDAMRERNETQVELARKKGRPDITVGIEYASVSMPRQIRPDRPYPASLAGANRLLRGMSTNAAGALIDLYAVAASDEPMSYRSGGDDNVMLSFTVNVPIWRKRVKAGVQEAANKVTAVNYEKRHAALALDAAAQNALFAFEDASRRARLYADSLVPKAEQVFESIQSAYSADLGATFLDLLDAERDLLEFQLEERRAARDRQLAAAELERIIGGPWTPAEANGNP